jgi:hypothetical protein
MNGEIAQFVALTSHGNAFLSGGYDARDFYPANSAFKFCNAVSFVEVKKFIKTRETEVAEDPNTWFDTLKAGGCRRLHIGHRPSSNPIAPERMLAGFVGGGGTWFAAAAYPERADHWLTRWEVSAPDAPDQRIWKVTYGKVASDKRVPQFEAPDLSARREELESVLARIESFAREHDIEFFASCFSKALEALASDEPAMPPYYPDLLPPVGYSTEARRILAACAYAWVFGGMGSWNDLGFESVEDQQEYERLSEELYVAVNRGIEKGANSYGR